MVVVPALRREAGTIAQSEAAGPPCAAPPAARWRANAGSGIVVGAAPGRFAAVAAREWEP